MKSENYKKFIREFFPMSYVINDSNINLIYKRVCENNVITEIYEKCIELNNTQCHISFLKQYRLQFNKLLIYIALNEETGINFCIRSTIEYLLKFIYSLYFDNTVDNINKISFRNIKDDFKDFYDTKLNINENELKKLLTYYGKYSNSIHGKEDDDGSLEYMGEIIKSKHYDFNKLDETLQQILDSYEIIMKEIFDFDEYPIASTELFRIKNSVSNKRFRKISLRIR